MSVLKLFDTQKNPLSILLEYIILCQQKSDTMYALRTSQTKSVHLYADKPPRVLN